MGFEEFLPESNENEEVDDSLSEDNERTRKLDKIGQNQVYDLVTGKQPDWQSIIYDLIHTEQLDPWDVDIVVLTNKYFEKLYELEEQVEGETDFYISSKVLLAAALLLRIKSEFLLNKHIKSIDEILFGKKETKAVIIERINIDEDELPLLIPKTPLPRQRKVTLAELMEALDNAINTESRRIKREVAVKRAHKLSHVDIPQFRKIDLKDRIKQFYARVLTSIKKKAQKPEKHLNKVNYHSLIGTEKEEKLACFLPLLHLSNTRKLWLEQEKHLDDIWIYLYEYFDKNKDSFFEELEKDLVGSSDNEITQELVADLAYKAAEEAEAESEASPLDKARAKREEKKKMEEEIKRELEAELGIKSEIERINKEEKIDEISGFDEDEN
ncbi:MAG: segregation/condensation protein A [Candidatus Pacearchaeota archaeon]